MLAKLPFRSKLTLVVSIPLLVLLGFAGFAIKGRWESLDTQQQYGHLVGPFQGLANVARAAGYEGFASEWYVRVRAGDPPASKELIFDARGTTDRAVKTLKATLPALDGRVSEETERAVQNLVGRLDSLLGYRSQVDSRSDPGPAFQDLATAALDAARDVARDVDDGELAVGLGAVLDLRGQQVALADEAALVMGRVAGARTGTVNEWIAAITAQEGHAQEFLENSSAAARSAYEATDADQPLENPVRSDAGGELPAAFPDATVTPDEYAEWYTNQQARYDGGVTAVQGVVDDEAAARESDARLETVGVSLGTAAVILVVLLLSWALVRSLNRPLRALTRGARDVSERRLPRLVDTLQRGGELTADQLEDLSPIDVQSEDEIGELAQAFNTIQQVTMAVAEQQSALLKKGIGDLYVNLARRNQSLLDRQISLLDEMEATVDDADELSALFELDHLATRMRRNAESLLVLSGADQPRQWGTAVPVLDVVRASAAEIADFARVTFFGFEGDVAVAGNAVADMTHILAELLENATAFSPPDTPVVVAGRAADRRYLITISDEGIGMDEARLANANALLARPPAPGLALSRTLGLHVVAHLASRYGIHVQLRPATGTGLTAVVALPVTLLARVGDTTSSAPPRAPAPAAPGPVVVEPVVPTPTHREDLDREPVDRVPVVWEPVVREPVAAEPRAGADAASGEPIAWRAGGAPRTAPSEEPPPRVAPRTAPAPAPAPASNGNGAGPHGLATRVPGSSLTHQPGTDATRGGEVRPRPDRVQDLLSRHEQGKREGRGHRREP